MCGGPQRQHSMQGTARPCVRVLPNVPVAVACALGVLDKGWRHPICCPDKGPLGPGKDQICKNQDFPSSSGPGPCACSSVPAGRREKTGAGDWHLKRLD